MSTPIPDLKVVAEEIAAVRPEWDTTVVLNILIGFRDKPLSRIRQASLRAARSTSARTPQAITWQSNWVVEKSSSTSTGLSRPLPECAHCAQPVTREAAGWLRLCPACAKPWTPVEFRETRAAGVPCPPHLREEIRRGLSALGRGVDE